jgi:hypothetical protein
MGAQLHESSRPESDASSSSSSSSRQRLLEATARDTASAWMKQLKENLALEGRAVEGGWPGTINEARGRCAALAARVLAANAMPALARDELGSLTRIAYDEARRRWRASE